MNTHAPTHLCRWRFRPSSRTLSMPIALWLDTDHSCVTFVRSSLAVIATERVSGYPVFWHAAHTLPESLTNLVRTFLQCDLLLPVKDPLYPLIYLPLPARKCSCVTNSIFEGSKMISRALLVFNSTSIAVREGRCCPRKFNEGKFECKGQYVHMACRRRIFMSL